MRLIIRRGRQLHPHRHGHGAAQPSPRQSWHIDMAPMLAANLGAGLPARLRLLPSARQQGLGERRTETMRVRLCRLPARVACQAGGHCLRMVRTWPWAAASTVRCGRLTQLPAVT